MDESRNNTGGFVLLWRRLRESQLWKLKPSVLKLALYYIMEARFQPGKFYDGAHEVELPAGSFITSLRTLAERTGLSLKEVRTAQRHLENLGFAAHKRARPGAQSRTLITVLNYSTYQASTENWAQRGAQSGALEGHSRGTVKNNGNKDSTPPPYIPPPSPEKPFELEPEEPEGDRVERKIEEVTLRLFERHRRRKCSQKVIKEKLRAIAKEADRPLEVLNKLDHCHSAWCRSRDWTKDDGEYQKSLESWLTLRARRWEVYPEDIPQNPTPAKPEPEMPWRIGAQKAENEREEMLAAIRENWGQTSERHREFLRKNYPELEGLDG